MKAVKINNGAYLPELAPYIENFCKEVGLEGMYPANWQAFFAQTAQFGGEHSEFWVVYEDDDMLQPCAFAMWYTMALPNISKVYCQAIHAWGKQSAKACEALLLKFAEFGKKHRAIWWSCDLATDSRVRLFRKLAKKHGYVVLDKQTAHCTFRRKT